MTLTSALTALRRYYGKPAPPISRDPFRLILWEQVAYLVPEAQRRLAYARLEREVGLTPLEVHSAPAATLRSIARAGGSIAPAVRAARLHESAERVLDDWDGDLRGALRLPLPQARKALGRFAMIGEPGADKILVFAGRARLLPLDSNGLRVLGRLGLITERRDYRATYRGAQETLARALPKRSGTLVDGFFLLQRHGQELCRRSRPACSRCPLQIGCAFARSIT